MPDASVNEAKIYLLGVRFRNIQLPSDEELGFPLCTSNPYTILEVERTEKNKTVLLKGLVNSTFRISNNGKDYDQPRHGLKL